MKQHLSLAYTLCIMHSFSFGAPKIAHKIIERNEYIFSSIPSESTHFRQMIALQKQATTQNKALLSLIAQIKTNLSESSSNQSSALLDTLIHQLEVLINLSNQLNSIIQNTQELTTNAETLQNNFELLVQEFNDITLTTELPL